MDNKLGKDITCKINTELVSRVFKEHPQINKRKPGDYKSKGHRE